MHTRKKQDIFLFNRKKNAIEKERVFERSKMEFCYGTKLGLFLGKAVFKRRFVSKLYACWAKSQISKKKIASFIEKNEIDTSELASPLKSFKSYNEFFIRKLKPEARQVEMQPRSLISPADSRLLVHYLDREKVVPVKGRAYTLSELLGTARFDSQFANGTCLIFRLAPADYHRFGYIDHGEQEQIWKTGHALHSVHPFALDSGLPVFTENCREAALLSTQNFGEVIHVDVGAMIVGRIVQHHPSVHSFSKGEEKGYFEFGGSSIVLLFKPHTLSVHKDIQEYSSRGIETLVSYGESIGEKK